MLNVGCGEMFRPLVLISAFCFQLSDLMPLISAFNFQLSAFDLVSGPWSSWSTFNFLLSAFDLVCGPWSRSCLISAFYSLLSALLLAALPTHRNKVTFAP